MSLLSFGDCAVVVPLTVIEELDEHKSRLDDVGRAARQAIREIEGLRQANGGDIRQAVTLPGGGTLRVETNGLLLDRLTEHGLDSNKPDNRILAAALGQQAQAPGPVMLITNDAALRIKAAQVGLEASEHLVAKSKVDHHDTGWRYVDASRSDIDAVFESGHPTQEFGCVANECLVLRNGSQSALVRFRGDKYVPVKDQEAWGLKPRSVEQKFALDLLTDPEVSVAALDGPAGTGKTILALAAGLEQVMESARYQTMAIYRPIVPVGKSDLGFLPGGIEEKLDPWMSAIHDAVVALTDTRSHQTARSTIDEMVDREKLTMESVTYLRGRSLQGTFVIVDEAQNLEPTTLKTILTRVGEGTKIIFTGDTSQIDAPFLSEHTNALAVLVAAFAGEPCFGHIRLTTCERSGVAALAADRL